MKFNSKIYNNKTIKTITIIFILLLLFLSVNFRIHFSVFIYPFIFYYFLRNYGILFNSILFPFIGFSYFICLFFYGFGQGFEVFKYIAFLSILVFGISGIITSIFYKYYKKENILSYTIFPLLFLLLNNIILGLSYGDNILLNGPIILSPYFSIVGWDIILFVVSIISIYLGVSIIKKRKFHIIGTLVLILLLYIGSFIIKHINKIDGEKIVIASIQGNNTFILRERIENAQNYLNYYIKQTKIAADNGAKVIIWPENAVLTDIYIKKGIYNSQAHKEVEKLSKLLNVVIVYGILENNIDKYYHTAIVMDPIKGMLKPYRAQIVFKDPAAEQKDEGKDSTIYDTAYGKFFILICYETTFMDLIDGFMDISKDNPVDFVITMANNQFLGKSRVMYSLISGYRGISAKIKKPLISSTNTGPTVYVDQNGDIVKEIEWNKPGILYSEVILSN